MHRSFAFVRAILAAAVTAMSSQFFLAVAAGALLISVITAPATAAPLVSWRVIHGIVTANDFGGGLQGDATEWTTMSGSATVDLGLQTIQFNVIGLTVAQNNPIGTTANTPQVAGTISCTPDGKVHDFASTQFVPLSPQGDASSGTLPISIPVSCTTSNISFFITILSNSPPFGTVYIAFGASRFTH
jgi:hypothetical protein